MTVFIHDHNRQANVFDETISPHALVCGVLLILRDNPHFRHFAPSLPSLQGPQTETQTVPLISSVKRSSVTVVSVRVAM